MKCEWTSMWQQSAKLDYKPIVDVRKVKPNQRKAKSDMDLRGAIVETAKYPTKPIEKMGKTEEQKLKVTDDLMKALKKSVKLGLVVCLKRYAKSCSWMMLREVISFTSMMKIRT